MLPYRPIMRSWPDGEQPKSTVCKTQSYRCFISSLIIIIKLNILLFDDETGTKFYPQLLLSANVALVKLNQCQRALKGLANLLSDQSICAGGSTTDACSVSFIIESLLCDRPKT